MAASERAVLDLVRAQTEVVQIMFDSDGTFYLPCYDSEDDMGAINDIDDFPQKYSELKKYFHKVRSNKKGGQVWKKCS